MYLRDVEDALSEWINLGVTSFAWDLYDASPELGRTISRVRDLARSKNPKSTFAAESLGSFMLESNGHVLDYTWNWVDEANSDPILSVLRSPRLNLNVEGPMAAKMAFICGNYLNIFPRQAGRENGTCLISEMPELSRAVKECADLRKQFLHYFVEGNLIGDSVLTEPTTGFVRAHVLDDRMLVFVLNDRDKPQKIEVKSNLRLWLPKADSYEVKCYNSSGRLVETTTAHGPEWLGITDKLAPCELAVFEIQAR